VLWLREVAAITAAEEGMRYARFARHSAGGQLAPSASYRDGEKRLCCFIRGRDSILDEWQNKSALFS
jgi:hypothetical protein